MKHYILLLNYQNCSRQNLKYRMCQESERAVLMALPSTAPLIHALPRGDEHLDEKLLFIIWKH